VEPQVTVPVTRAGLERGADEALEAALAWIAEESQVARTRAGDAVAAESLEADGSR
jgi:hypothetical protein